MRILRDALKYGLMLQTPRNGPWALSRVLVVPQSLVELHKEKPVATLEYLLCVAKEGSPREALSATAFAVALELSPFDAVDYAYFSAVSVDDPHTERVSGRKSLIARVTDLLSARQKLERK